MRGRFVLSAVAIAAAVWACSPLPGMSATISVISNDSVPIIGIQGEILLGDERKFIDVALNRSDALVAFHSPGGNLNAGIEIGRAIRLKGFSTVVIDGDSCASACALAWLGGRKRAMVGSGRIGFHAAYLSGPAGPTIASSGNAIVGAYLNQLGLSSAAIIYLTSAPPDGMTWLSAAEAQRRGLEVMTLDAPSPAAPHALIPAAPPPTAALPIYVPALPATPQTRIDWTVQGEWVQTASRMNLADAVEVASEIKTRNANTAIFQYRNGWFGVVVGPFPPTRGAVALAALLTAQEVPEDSLVTRGDAFVSLVWGAPTPRVKDGAPRTPAALALAATRNFFDTGSSHSIAALGFLRDAYQDQIIYYGKAVSKLVVLQEKERYFDRWPQRRYSLRADTVSINCDQASASECTVSGLVDWSAFSTARARHSVGTSTFSLKFRADANGPRILEESSANLTRQVSRTNE